KNLAEAIRARLARNPKLRQAVEDERLSMDIAGAILAAREEAGVTQAQLAERADMKQSAIARMESAEYEGHSISSLKRIAAALGKRVSVQFLPASSSSGGEVGEAQIDWDIRWRETEEWKPSLKTAIHFEQAV